MWQQNAMCDPEWDSGTEKNILVGQQAKFEICKVDNNTVSMLISWFDNSIVVIQDVDIWGICMKGILEFLNFYNIFKSLIWFQNGKLKSNTHTTEHLINS